MTILYIHKFYKKLIMNNIPILNMKLTLKGQNIKFRIKQST